MSRTITWRRKAAGLTAGVAVAALALTACSSGGGSDGGGETTGPVSQADIDEAMKTPTKLTFWTWVPDIEKEVKLFEDAYPAIDVEVVNVGQGADHYQKLRSALKAGEGAPDVAQVEFQHLSSFALGDNLLDLTPYMPADVGDDYVPWVWEQVKSTDGEKVWGVPQDSGPMGLLYREDLLSQHGIEVPTTWDAFAQAATDLHAKDPNLYLTNLPGNDMGQFTALLWQAGARPFGWDGKETVTIDLMSDEATQVAQYWGDLVAADAVSVDPDFTDAWYQGLANGKYASWVAAAWGPVFLQGTAANTSGLWRASTIPQWEDGANVSANWGGSSDAVLASTKNPIAASQLALWINHDKASTMTMATEQFLFPTTTEVLEDPQFADEKSEFYGGQEVNKLFAEVSSTVEPDFGWLPFMDYAYSAGEETVGKAIADKTDLVEAMQAWQDKLTTYAEQQGFTVAD
ncbi:sugar ABC transporter substrate-binding protein [Cellulomonas algicola]|uniref:Sugar ABC transporter substrate-binding protein n=1 Tax=Cellulomonas algicola TaxID=2071633 RepID=A0A401UVW5_9CELL|nr:extracellular solute-binding protein [Cellulomonas algicola]GCD18752.1 sugar ABC transporter substrate-binding protein [Cellulomonas algicola]